MIDKIELWTVILGLGAGSFLLRFAFIGFVGNRALPPWLLRHLRYTAVAFLPGLVTPLVVWPEATGGTPDPARLLAAAVTIGLGVWTRNVLAAISGGVLSFVLAVALL